MFHVHISAVTRNAKGFASVYNLLSIPAFRADMYYDPDRGRYSGSML